MIECRVVCTHTSQEVKDDLILSEGIDNVMLENILAGDIDRDIAKKYFERFAAYKDLHYRDTLPMPTYPLVVTRDEINDMYVFWRLLVRYSISAKDTSYVHVHFRRGGIAGLKILRLFPIIESIFIHSTNRTPIIEDGELVTSLFELSYCPMIKNLYVSNMSNITVEGIEHCTNIEELFVDCVPDFSFHGITPEILRLSIVGDINDFNVAGRITGLERFTKLKELCLRRTNLTMIPITECKLDRLEIENVKIETIENLDLSELKSMYITFSLMHLLVPSLHMPVIESLSITVSENDDYRHQCSQNELIQKLINERGDQFKISFLTSDHEE
jgi:hypothetical protein